MPDCFSVYLIKVSCPVPSSCCFRIVTIWNIKLCRSHQRWLLMQANIRKDNWEREGERESRQTFFLPSLTIDHQKTQKHQKEPMKTIHFKICLSEAYLKPPHISDSFQRGNLTTCFSKAILNAQKLTYFLHINVARHLCCEVVSDILIAMLTRKAHVDWVQDRSALCAYWSVVLL